MAERELGEITDFDERMISARTAVLVHLIETGRVNHQLGLDLIEMQKAPEVIWEERDAFVSISNGGPIDDSPLYRLGTQIVKVKPGVHSK